MNKQRKTSHILNVFQYDETTGAVTLPSSLSLATPDSADNSTKVATTAWIRAYVGSLSYATASSVTTAIANLVASAPTTLDTLNELATALGNDPNFATTITTSLGNKLSLTGGTLTGDLTLSGTNPRLYFTDTDNNPDYFISNTDGTFTVYDVTNSVGRFKIYTTGNAEFSNNLTALSFVKTGGTAIQFLKADGSVDSSTYLTGITSGQVTTALGYTPVPTTRTITINGTAYNLSADVSWTIASGVTAFNTRTGAITLTSGDVTGALGFTPYNATNPSGYISGITSLMVTNALGFTPYNATNPNGYITSAGNISGYAMSLNGYANQTEYTILNGPANGPVWKVRYDSATANRYVDLGFKDGNGTYYEGFKIYNNGTPTWVGNTILHAGNWNSYAPGLTGGGASGTWGINITGSSANVNGKLTSDGWVRTVGDSTQLQFYGNSRVMIYRTDGNTNPHGGGGYAHIFYYGGSADGNRVFIVNTDGRLYSPYHGWLDTMSISGTASNITAYTINQSVGTGNSPSWAEGTFGTTGGATNQGIQIRYQNYVSGYGRIRFYQSDSNHATIHVFSSSWQNGTLAGSSTGAINLDSGTGVTFGAWNNPDAYVVTGGQTYARGYRGIGNIAGTGEASYHPAGMYSVGTQWLYGDLHRNNANTYSQGHIYCNGNHGYGLVGLYSSIKYQAIFAMGDAYKIHTDGSGLNNLYGLAWSHPNAGGQAGYLNDHGLIVGVAGTTYAAISSNIWARGSITANTHVYATNGYFYGSGSIRCGDMWGGAGLYRPSGDMVFGTEGYNWVFSSQANTRAYFASGDGNLWMQWSGEWLSTTLGRKHQNGSNPSYGAVYSDNWFRAYGDTGLYSQDYGGYFRRNTNSYGTWESVGYAKNGWGGYVNNNNYIVSWMLNTSGDFGFLTQNGNWWNLFYNNGNNCWGIGTDNTYSGDGFRCIKYGSSQYGWTTWSDRRAKENISSITGALDKVLNMRGVYFNYINDEAKNKRVGFIAQELEQVLPEAVRYAEEIDEYNVEYAQIVSVLAEAIKEQNIKITRLEALVEQLTNN